MRKVRKRTYAEPVVAQGALGRRFNIGGSLDLGGCPIGSQMLYFEHTERTQ